MRSKREGPMSIVSRYRLSNPALMVRFHLAIMLLATLFASIGFAADPSVTSVVVNFADGSSQTLASTQPAPATQPAPPLVVLAGKGDVPLVVHVHLPENMIVD